MGYFGSASLEHLDYPTQANSRLEWATGNVSAFVLWSVRAQRQCRPRFLFRRGFTSGPLKIDVRVRKRSRRATACAATEIFCPFPFRGAATAHPGRAFFAEGDAVSVSAPGTGFVGAVAGDFFSLEREDFRTGAFRPSPSRVFKFCGFVQAEQLVRSARIPGNVGLVEHRANARNLNDFTPARGSERLRKSCEQLAHRDKYAPSMPLAPPSATEFVEPLAKYDFAGMMTLCIVPHRIATRF
jgi:hypothetical protein